MRPVLAPPEPSNLAGGPTPAFSVVIAAYDAADTIADAVESVLAQTVHAVEIVVCDDGSRDDLVAALEPFRESITLVVQEHAGEGAAKNNGAFHARRGDFVVFLDADDAFFLERLEALGELAAARPDLDILTTDALLEIDGEVVRRCYEADWTFEVDDQRGAILERNFVFGHAAVRRTRFMESGGFEPSIRYGTDWDLWCRLVLEGSRIGLVDEPLAHYRLRRTSLSADRPALLEGRCRVLERAASRDDLAPDERGRVQKALAREQRNALLACANAALLDGSPRARQLAIRVARTPSLPARTRARSALAALAPRLASKRLASAVELAGEIGPAGVRLPAPSED